MWEGGSGEEREGMGGRVEDRGRWVECEGVGGNGAEWVGERVV